MSNSPYSAALFFNLEKVTMIAYEAHALLGHHLAASILMRLPVLAGVSASYARARDELSGVLGVGADIDGQRRAPPAPCLHLAYRELQVSRVVGACDPYGHS